MCKFGKCHVLLIQYMSLNTGIANIAIKQIFARQIHLTRLILRTRQTLLTRITQPIKHTQSTKLILQTLIT
jgi:hypothetical protein